MPFSTGEKIMTINYIPMSVVLAGITLPAEMLAELAELDNSPWQFKRIAARGLAARLGTPETQEHVRRWAQSLDKATFRQIQRMHHDQVMRLSEDLEELIEIVSEGGKRSAEFVLDLCQRRDLIESVSAVLQLTGEEGDISFCSVVDDQAHSLMSSFDMAGEERDNDKVLTYIATARRVEWWTPMV